MKVGVYDVINDPLPKLMLIKEIDINREDLKYDKSIVELMNKHFKMDKLTSEYVYALAVTNGLNPKGIIFVSSGDCHGASVDYRKLFIGLLLLGAEQFMCFHNHPGGNKKISKDDIETTKRYYDLGNFIGIRFLKHIMITKDFFDYCKNEWDCYPFL